MTIITRDRKDRPMKRRLMLAALAVAAPLALATQPAAAQEAKKPNILFIMGDDIGRMQPGSTTAA